MFYIRPTCYCGFFSLIFFFREKEKHEQSNKQIVPPTCDFFVTLSAHIVYELKIKRSIYFIYFRNILYSRFLGARFFLHINLNRS